MRPFHLLAAGLCALVLAGLGLIPDRTIAASFDCAAAAGPTDQAVCADPALSARDDAVGAIHAWAISHGKHGKVFDDPAHWRASLRGEADPAALTERYGLHIDEMLQATNFAADLGPLYRREDGAVRLQIIPLKDGWFAYHLRLRLRNGIEITAGDSGVARLIDGEALDLSRACHLTFTQESEDVWQLKQSGDCIRMMTLGGQVLADLGFSGRYRRAP